MPSRPRVSERGLASFVAFGCAPPGETLFENVYRVRGGETCVVTRSSITRTRTETAPELASAEARNANRSIDTLASALWQTIVDAVSEVIEEHTHVAVLGGGGLDSGALLAATIALTRGASPREVSNVFMAFDGPESDVPYHRDLARSLGITPLLLTPLDVPCDVATAPDICLDGQPYPYPTLPFDLTWHRRAREAGATLVITGAGGDELLGGDLRFMAARARRSPLGALREALALQVPWPTTPASRLREWLAQPLAKPHVPTSILVRHIERQHLARMPWLGEATRECIHAAAVSQAQETADLSPTGRYLREAYAPSWSDFADARAQLEIATSIKRADPLLSSRVLRFVSSVPVDRLACDHLHRGLLRRALRGRVPDSLRLRTGKAYFEPALHQALAAPAFAHLLASLSDPNETSARDLVNRTRYVAAHRALLATPAPEVSWPDLWQAIGAEAFLRANA